MFLYDGNALGVASTVPGREFMVADCCVSIRGGTTSSHLRSFNSYGISFGLAESHISGTVENRNGLDICATKGSVVIENVNVLNRITADKVEAHIYSEHRSGDNEPASVISGSSFQNLRIDGRPLQIQTSDDFSSRYPTFGSIDAAFQNRFSRHQVTSRFVGSGLPEESAATGDLRAVLEAYREQLDLERINPPIVCSFVTRVTDGSHIKAWGPIISVPSFGNLYLGEVTIWPWKRCLNMFRVELTSGGSILGCCIGAGSAQYSKVSDYFGGMRLPESFFQNNNEGERMPNNFQDDRIQTAYDTLSKFIQFLSACQREHIRFESGAFNLLAERIGSRLTTAAKSGSTQDLLKQWNVGEEKFLAEILIVAKRSGRQIITKQDIQNAFKLCPPPPDLD